MEIKDKKMIKTLYLYFRWLFWDYEPYACTFFAYIEKLKKDAKWIRFKPTFSQVSSRRKAIYEYKIIGKKVIVRSREI